MGRMTMIIYAGLLKIQVINGFELKAQMPYRMPVIDELL